MHEPLVIATPAAAELIHRLQAKHGPLMFHQGGGCCDGGQPMCFVDGEFKLGAIDLCLGEIEGCKFYMAADQYAHWKHTQLILDVTKGRGSSFSLEIPLGVRFFIHARIFSGDTWTPLSCG